jgi:hypothetical protein
VKKKRPRKDAMRMSMKGEVKDKGGEEGALLKWKEVM